MVHYYTSTAKFCQPDILPQTSHWQTLHTFFKPHFESNQGPFKKKSQIYIIDTHISILRNVKLLTSILEEDRCMLRGECQRKVPSRGDIHHFEIKLSDHRMLILGL